MPSSRSGTPDCVSGAIGKGHRRDMSELAVTGLQFGLLLLLWILILSIIGAQSRDMAVSKKARRRTRQDTRQTAPPPPRASEETAPATSSTGRSSGQVPRPRPSKLVVVQGPLQGKELPLASSPILLGRAQECSLVLEDDYASGKHARFFPQGSRWFLEDLGSTNGTWLGDEQLTRASTVEPGDRIRIGKTVLELRT